MIWETWIMVLLYIYFGFASGGQAGKYPQILRMFRLVRLVRVARATRLLHSCPELCTLAKGMIAGMRSVMSVLCLLSLIIYIFAIMFTMTLSESSAVPSSSFATVPASMDFLFMQVLCAPSA